MPQICRVDLSPSTLRTHVPALGGLTDTNTPCSPFATDVGGHCARPPAIRHSSDANMLSVIQDRHRPTEFPGVRDDCDMKIEWLAIHPRLHDVFAVPKREDEPLHCLGYRPHRRASKRVRMDTNQRLPRSRRYHAAQLPGGMLHSISNRFMTPTTRK